MLLTDEQLAIVRHARAVFVRACPGSGKTRTIVQRAARLISELPIRRGVAVLSFTNAAIDKFREAFHSDGLSTALCCPHFVDTFDAFVRHFVIMPTGIDGSAEKPLVTESWEQIGVGRIRLKDPEPVGRFGVSLDWFDPAADRLNTDAISVDALRRHVEANRAEYEGLCRRRLRQLRSRGRISTAEARTIAVQRITDPPLSTALGRAVAARFAEVLVDEAQDCNEQDYQILKWLRQHGISVSVIGDPEQSIFDFRQRTGVTLAEFSSRYKPGDQLPLSGNFRSSPAICRLAASLKTSRLADRPVGDMAGVLAPIALLDYGAKVSTSIAEVFLETIAQAERPITSSVVLAHARSIGQAAVGEPRTQDSSPSRLATLASAVVTLNSNDSSSREKQSALRRTERLVLDILGAKEEETAAESCDRLGLDRRSLARMAVDITVRLPPTCGPSADDAAEWIASAKSAFGSLDVIRKSKRQVFGSPKSDAWAAPLRINRSKGATSSTIHESKGREFDAVAVVIPPNGRTNRTEELFRCWETGVESEAKRVLYVAVTRPKQLLLLAVPSQFLARCEQILRASSVPYEAAKTL